MCSGRWQQESFLPPLPPSRKWLGSPTGRGLRYGVCVGNREVCGKIISVTFSRADGNFDALDLRLRIHLEYIDLLDAVSFGWLLRTVFLVSITLPYIIIWSPVSCCVSRRWLWSVRLPRGLLLLCRTLSACTRRFCRIHRGGVALRLSRSPRNHTSYRGGEHVCHWRWW